MHPKIKSPHKTLNNLSHISSPLTVNKAQGQKIFSSFEKFIEICNLLIERMEHMIRFCNFLKIVHMRITLGAFFIFAK